MFSVDQKNQIAQAVENVLMSFNHPEMPKEKPVFKLSVRGNTSMSWAEITPNWIYDKDNKPHINPHNEEQAKKCGS